MLAIGWRPTEERQADSMCTDKGFIVSDVNRGKPTIHRIAYPIIYALIYSPDSNLLMMINSKARKLQSWIKMNEHILVQSHIDLRSIAIERDV